MMKDRRLFPLALLCALGLSLVACNHAGAEPPDPGYRRGNSTTRWLSRHRTLHPTAVHGSAARL